MTERRREDCTGCTACAQVCPTGCLVMERDAEGFFYPVLRDPAACVDCGRCKAVCPVLHIEAEGKVRTTAAFGCRLKDRTELLGSTSGGVFYAAAKHVLAAGGVVWGAAYGENLHVVHRAAESLTELEALRKSKYVESELGSAFQEVERTLKAGRMVLFSGTPCQIAGLKAFLGRDYENLIAMQVFCSQIMGAEIWRRYLAYQKSNCQGEISAYDFRYKKLSDIPSTKAERIGGYIYIVTEHEKKYVFSRSEDILIWAFAENLVGRPSCTECRFKLKGNPFAADLAIGDFWGSENNAPECYDPMGASAVIAYSDKGKKFLEALDAELLIRPVSIEAVWKGNPGACSPAAAHPNRNNFYQELIQGETPLDILIRKSLLVSPSLLGKGYRFGLFGGYNARMAILSLCAGTDSSLAYQYSNSSLISLMSAPVSQPEGLRLPRNPFRGQMLAADMSKEFVLSDSSRTVDYLVIDFLEERFDLVVLEDSYLTLSDALRDSDFPRKTMLSRLAPETGRIWEESCLQFIRFLRQHFLPEQVILVRTLLSERYMDASGQLLPFANSEEIRALNRMLCGCYDFFERNYPIKNVVSIENQSVLFCEKDHKHGVQPCHMNTDYCRAVAEHLAVVVCKESKREVR